MKTVSAAGGIIVKHTDSGWKILIIKDKYGKWTFPKGHIENGERPDNTAQREINEETGLSHLIYLRALSQIEYLYTQNSETIKKTVQYYLYEFSGSEPVVCQQTEGITAFDWVSQTEIIDRIGYPDTNIPLLTQVDQILKTLKQS
jgi:8-oxo-dGTP pyrophosphatase MutT (NUDIX family)